MLLALLECRSTFCQAVALTMSMTEVRRSLLLTGMDTLLFLLAGLAATRWWLETRGREQELMRLGFGRSDDVAPLVRRRQLLQLLSLSSFLRTLGLLIDWQFLVLFYTGRHKKRRFPWHRLLGYFLSSLPTMVWLSTLSVLLLFLAESYHKTRMYWAPLLRPTIIFFNALAWLLYITFAFIGFGLTAGRLFRQSAYFLMAVVRLFLVAALLYFGTQLSLQLRVRARASRPLLRDGGVQEDILGAGGGIGGTSHLKFSTLFWKVLTLTLILSATESIRLLKDLDYVWGGSDFLRMSVEPGSRPCHPATIMWEKLFLEWLPSVALLVAVRPHDRGSDSDGGRVDALMRQHSPGFAGEYSEGAF